MSTTYTTNYHLGKQEDTSDNFNMSVITDNMDTIDSALGNKSDKSSTYTKTEVDAALGSKQNTISDLSTIRSGAALGATAVQPETGKGLSTNDYTTAEKTKLAGIAEGAEVNEIEGIKVNNTTINPDANKVVNITVPTTAADVSALPDTTKYAAALSLTINSSTFVMTGQLKDQNGDNLGTAQTIDLPLESVVVNGSYDSQTKKVVLTLQNGNTIEFSVADLVSGLQTELSTSNKLNPAFIEYDSTHRAVSDTEKSAWNSKQNALSSTQLDAVNSGIDSTKVEQIETNKSNISLLCDANGKKQLIPNFGILTNGSVTYTHNSDSTITITGSKRAGAENYVDIVQKSYEDYGLKSGDTIQVMNRDSAPVILAIIFTSSTSASSPNYTLNGTNTYTLPENYTGFCIRLLLTSSSTNVNVTINPLVCNKALYDISSAITPYSMSNAELTAVKQNALSSAQLDAVNSGIDSTKVEQIETNKNNISKDEAALVELVDGGAKNRFLYGDLIGITDNFSDKPLLLPAGEYKIMFDSTTSSGVFAIRLKDSKDNSIFYITTNNTATTKIYDVAITTDAAKITIYSSVSNNFTNFMICTKAAWDISHEYQPYRPSYQELYERVVALEQANQ